jgi:hypothetical protein
MCILIPSLDIQQQETVVYSMDGLFGLPRKKSAGTSYRKSLHGHLYFKDQGDVDQFVREAQRGKQIANVSFS